MPDSLIDRLRAEDPETGLRHSIASEAADRIEELEKAICDYAAAVVEMEGVTFEEHIEDDASRKIVIEALNARAALEGKDA